MATGGRESSDFSSDDEALHPVKKRQKKTKVLVSDSDSETDDFVPRPKRTLRPLLCESGSSSNESRRSGADSGESSSSSSDNEQIDKCAICLSKFSGQDIATPEGCDHMFCLLCLQEWAKNNNTCPIDRLKFNLILIRHHNEQKICKRIFISCPESDWLSDSESGDAHTQIETAPCSFCGEHEDVDVLQMCRECDKNFHQNCLMYPQSAQICPACAFYIRLNYFKSSREWMNFCGRLSEASDELQGYSRGVWRVRQKTHDLLRRLHDRRLVSASDSTSDEDTQQNSYNSVRLYEGEARLQCPLVQKRRRAVCRSRNQALVSTATSATFNPGLYSVDSDDEINDFRYDNSDNRLNGEPSSSSRSFSSIHSGNNGLRSKSPENYDIVGSILQSQTLLHRSDVLKLKRDGTVLPDSSRSPNSRMNSSSASSSSGTENRWNEMPSFSQSRPVLPCTNGTAYKQNPLNPTQNSNAKYGETPKDNYTCTSSSTSKGPSLNYDSVNISTRNTFPNSGNERYNNDNSCSSVNHKSFCDSSTVDDIKKVSNFKESNKAHSEDEVDIYSDIESVGDDEGACNAIETVGDRIEPMEIPYKDDESPSSNPEPASDSSDNELVIDEDIAADDENENRKENFQMNNSNDKSGVIENKQVNDSEESNVSYSDNFNHEQSNRTPEVQDNGSYVDSQSAEDSQLNEELSQETFQSNSGPRLYKNDSEYDESKHGSEYEEVKNESECDESKHGSECEENKNGSECEESKSGFEDDENKNESEYDETKNGFEDDENKNNSEYDESKHGSEYEEGKIESECREDKNRSEDEDEDKNVSMVDENRNASEYDDQESDMDVQVYEENSVDSSKKSPRAETSTPCSTLSSPKQCDEEMKQDNLDSQYDNSISSGAQEFYDALSRKDSGAMDISSMQTNENTSGSFSQVEENENYQNENNSNFSFASSQNVMSESEEAMDSNVDVSQAFSEGDDPDINIHRDINMKSGEYQDDDSQLNDENVDYSENVSTPCLDENIDGQIEDSPLHSDNVESTDPDIKKNVTYFYSKSCKTPPSNDEYETVENEKMDHKMEEQLESSEKTPENAVDLGIEDISEAGSGDLDDDFGDENISFTESKEQENVERENSSKFNDDDDQNSKLNAKHLDTSHNSDQSYDDREEGEIIEEKPAHRPDRKRSEKHEHYHDENEDYGEVAPRMNISDLPRIPKIKRNRLKDSSPLEIPIETKRTSVLGRVDLGGGDISWKRLSKQTRDRSYRDGRPKDERVLYRERESRKKEKKFSSDAEWRSDSKSRRRDDKRQDSEKIKSEYESRSRKNDKKDNKISDWDYSDRDKRSKSHKDKHKDKHKDRKDKGKHEKTKYSKDETKYGRDRNKDDDHYERELKIDKEQRFERIVYEKSKCKDKDHKNKHKDRKSDNKSTKEHSREKHKHIHIDDHFSEKQREREVRKIDDKLKIVVEQKDGRKDKSKHKDKKELKQDKKTIHLHEHRKKEVERTSYSELTSIESKEIFAKGDSIIINVNFNRAISPKDAPVDNIDSNLKDRKGVEEFEADELVITSDKSKKHSLADRGKNVLEASVTKRPATPPERNNPVLCVSESYWQGGDDSDANNSPDSGKSVMEIPNSEEENDNRESADALGDNFSNSCTSTDEPESQSAVKETGVSLNEEPPEKTDNIDISFVKEPEILPPPAKRRSPRSPSPPSPADNDSYDPCEPTRSPSPPPIPIAPPLPAGNPKPPSPELPPLPPEPEPVDNIREEAVSHKPSEFAAVSSVVTSSLQAITANSQTSVANSISMPSILLPPPSFLSQTPVTTNSLPSLSSLIPPSNFNFQINSHSNVIFQPNHVQQVIRGIIPTQMHTTTTIPPPPNPPSLPHMGSVPPPPPPPSAMALISQIRHPQINVRPTLTPNSLLQNLTMGHPVTMPQMQLTHLHIPPHMTNPLSSQQSPMMIPSQNQSLNLPVSIQNQSVSRVVLPQNQMNHSVLQNQNLILKSQVSVVSHQTLSNNTPQKLDKVTTEKTEVIDMDVDSPYSPGDSPSMDSVCDYSPTCSPLTSTPKNKDIFDSLLPSDHRTSDKRTQDTLGKAEKSKRSDSKNDTPNKRAKHEHKRHSVRMQLADKNKSHREQKIEKKLDDSQLKILDELPSSAVEMQVKEKFLKKLNRQERVVEEVKLVLKPYYKTRDVNKEEYKDILRKAVPKIYHNKSGEINPVKVKNLVDSYIKKIKHSRKKEDKKKTKLS